MKYFVIGFSLIISVYSTSALANIEELQKLSLEELMEVTIVTGARQSLAKAPGVVSVITAKDIEEMGARDLDEVIETIPGLHVSRETQGYRPIYTIRGIYSGRNPEVLMLINGIPITSLFTGTRGFGWGGMPINMISRIEVIRGPGSAVYGADAFAGVINLITKTKKEIDGTEIGARLGSFNTYEGWALHGDKWNGFDVAASLEYRSTDGQNSIIDADAQTTYDKIYNTHVSLAPGPVSTGGKSIEARIDLEKGHWQARAGYQGRRHLGVGSGIAQALVPDAYFMSERTNADLTYHNPTLAPFWDVTVQTSYLDVGYELFENRGFPRGAFGGTYPDGYIGNPGASERHFRFDTFAFYSGFKNHLIRLGSGYHFGDQYKVTYTANYGINPATGQPLPAGSPVIDFSDTPYSYNQEKRRKNWYLSLQDTWLINDQWEFTGGVRYDNYSDFGETTNPRAALVWQPDKNFTTKLMFGSAFRAPSFAELYNKNNPVVLGNPNLKPELINTWELAFDYRILSNLNIITNLFKYDIKDKVSFVPSIDGKSMAGINIGRWKGEGFELEGRWKIIPNFNLIGNYSYVRTLDKSNGKDIGNYPQNSAHLRANWLFLPDWNLDFQTKWIADRKRPAGDTRSAIADYIITDLTLRYRKSQTNIAFSVRNLFNADAREPSLGPDSKGIISIPNDLPLAKRNLFVEFRYHF